ncbi:MAG: PKD domain-containing protein [Cyclobacteriaceae bacterium]
MARPENYTGTGLMPTPVSNFADINAGRYYLDVYSGTCLTQQTSTVVQAVAFPQFRVSAPSAGFLCQGQSETITLTPSSANVSYQWYEKTSGIISGETNQSLVVSTAGNYYGVVTSTLYGACPSANSDTVSIKVVSLPVVNFSVPSTVCVGQLVTFTDLSTTDPQATPVYSWTFGDSNGSSDESPTYTYTAASTYTAQLKVTYTGRHLSSAKIAIHFCAECSSFVNNF